MVPKIMKACLYPISWARACPRYPETVPPMDMAAVVSPNVRLKRPEPLLMSLVTRMYMVPNTPAPTPSKICVDRMRICMNDDASSSPTMPRRSVRMRHLMGTENRPIKNKFFRPYFPEKSPQIFALRTIKTCATMIQSPLKRIPSPPLPIARLCMTRGSTVPFERWNRKQTTMKVSNVGSRKTWNGVSAVVSAFDETLASPLNPRLKLGLLAMGALRPLIGDIGGRGVTGLFFSGVSVGGIYALSKVETEESSGVEDSVTSPRAAAWSISSGLIWLKK
mmetsp:Transcript_17733/g.32062  ORF Transcript_17733/g.32062 Transcript_17733/m.32062 type:complete len:278 (+) Transcript_17733:408-1241(+)